jgi:hypothetical protein
VCLHWQASAAFQTLEELGRRLMKLVVASSLQANLHLNYLQQAWRLAVEARCLAEAKNNKSSRVTVRVRERSKKEDSTQFTKDWPKMDISEISPPEAKNLYVAWNLWYAWFRTGLYYDNIGRTQQARAMYVLSPNSRAVLATALHDANDTTQTLGPDKKTPVYPMKELGEKMLRVLVSRRDTYQTQDAPIEAALALGCILETRKETKEAYKAFKAGETARRLVRKQSIVSLQVKCRVTVQ